MLGRASGIGQNDPALADQHLTLCWQNNALYYRMLNGQIRIDGVIPQPTGVLLTRPILPDGIIDLQVNSQTATLGGLLDSLGKRLNSLASTEKLEGFSLSGSSPRSSRNVNKRKRRVLHLRHLEDDSPRLSRR